MSGVPGTTLRLNDLLKDSEDLEVVILVVMAYYSKRTESKISKGKRCR